MDLWNKEWHITTENKLRKIKHSVKHQVKYIDYRSKNEESGNSISRLRTGHTKFTHGHLIAKTTLMPNMQHSIKHIII